MLTLPYALLAALLFVDTQAEDWPTDIWFKGRFFVDLFHYQDNDCQEVVGKKETVKGDYKPKNKCWSFDEPFSSYYYDIAELLNHQYQVPRALHGNCDWRDGCGNPRTDIYMTVHGVCTIEVYPNTKCLGQPIHTHNKANWELNTHKCINNFWTNPQTHKREQARSIKVYCRRPGADILQGVLVGDPLAYNFCPAGPPDVYNTTLTENLGDPYFVSDEDYPPAIKSCEEKTSTAAPATISSSTGPVMTTISTVLVVPVSVLGSSVAGSSNVSSAPSHTSSTPRVMKTRFSTEWVAPSSLSRTLSSTSTKP